MAMNSICSVEISWEYLAGLVDADGCVYVGKRNSSLRCINPRYFVALNVANTDSKLLDDLKNQFGGFISKDGRSNCARWIIQGESARTILTELCSILRVKYVQALIALQMLDSMGDKHKTSKHTTPDDILTTRESLYQENKALNSGSYGKKK